jgi:hypothetical protein
MVRLFLIMWIGIISATGSNLWAQSASILLAEGAGKNAPRQPQASVTPEGIVDVVIAYKDEIGLFTSRDQGREFRTAGSRISCANLSVGMRRGPRVVRTKSSVIVTAIGGAQGAGKDGDLMAWRSEDDGKTWSRPVIVNDQADAAREGLHAMGLSPDGTLWCVWLDLRRQNTEVYASRSADDGRHWEKNLLVYRSPDGSVCECCHPSVCFPSKEQVAILFRNSWRGNRDMYVSQSTGPSSFEDAQMLGNEHWKLNACPMDGGMVAASQAGGLVSVWSRDGEIFATSQSRLVEHSLGIGEQPWVAATSQGPLFAWTQRRAETLRCQMGVSGKPEKIASSAFFPVVASDLNSPIAIVCWESRQEGANQVFAYIKHVSLK